ncbi:Glutamine transport ATP-binding protein GlnQ [Paenibacillus allorhizoplanae]|uniref:Glutamine transport ATP-binding protein GlnQ n=1 Tax=Paenibacillus allorhizoplanae TaxID=2905648 RepID=A0ABM9C5V8_9BACL|nr:ATP-binding cassette domain-containing protein [Paenibacillus allorhizoplanae]CAH1203510.1 Glutamine transport ATP-binding protein GlnQ [Paenibacillus allorhizoplanae]
MLTVRNLSKVFPPDNQVLSQISFQVDAGEFIAVIGSSGSGKTTLLRCISHQEKWTSGQLIYNSIDITKPGPWDRFKLGKDFAYLEEKPFLNRNKSAVKNVLMGRVYQAPLRMVTGLSSRNEKIDSMDFLEKVGLLDKGEKKVGQLSGGEQQRVAIAKALILGPKVLVADEPVSGLDPKSTEYILQDLKSLCKERHMSVIATLHKVELAERFATRIWGVSEGRIVLDIPARPLTLNEKMLVFGQI